MAKSLKLLAFVMLVCAVAKAQQYNQEDLDTEFNLNVGDYVRTSKSEMIISMVQFETRLYTVKSMKVVEKSECDDCKKYVIKGIVEEYFFTYYNDINWPSQKSHYRYLPYKDTLYACLSNPSGLDNFPLRRSKMPTFFPRTATAEDDAYLDNAGTSTTISDLTLDNNAVYELLPTGTYIGAFNQSARLESVCGIDDDNEYFSITDNKLYVRDPLNLGVQASYEINVKYDNGLGQFRRKKFTITALDGGDNHAPADVELSTLTIPFFPNFETPIVDVITTDEDVDDTHTIMLVSGPGDDSNSYLTVVDNKLRQAKLYDHSLDTLRIRIRVIDSKNGFIEKAFKIKLQKAETCAKPVPHQYFWWIQLDNTNGLWPFFYAGDIKYGDGIGNYWDIPDFSVLNGVVANYNTGCIATSDAIVPVFPPACPDTGIVITNDNSATLTVSATNNINVNTSRVFWQLDGVTLPGSTNKTLAVSAPGTYTALVPYSNCAMKASFTVLEDSCPKPVVTRNGDVVSATFGDNFTWYLDDSPLDIHDQSIEISEYGNYSVEVEYTSGCKVKSDPLVVNWLGSDCAKPEISLNGNVLTSTPAATYSWARDDYYGFNTRSVTPYKGRWMVLATYPNGCRKISEPYVVPDCSLIPEPKILLSGNETSVVNALSVNVSAPEVKIYEWSRDDIKFANNSRRVEVDRTEHTYKLKITYNDGCTKESSPFVMNSCAFAPEVEIEENGSTLTSKIDNSLVSSSAWYYNNEEVLTNSESINVDFNGTYMLKVTFNNGCVKTSEPIVVTGLKDDLTSFTISPNPGDGIFTVMLGILAGPSSATVYNSVGQLVLFADFNTQTFSFDISGVPTGVYLVRITNGSTVSTRRLIRR